MCFPALPTLSNFVGSASQTVKTDFHCVGNGGFALWRAKPPFPTQWKSVFTVSSKTRCVTRASQTVITGFHCVGKGGFAPWRAEQIFQAPSRGQNHLSRNSENRFSLFPWGWNFAPHGNSNSQHFSSRAPLRRNLFDNEQRICYNFEWIKTCVLRRCQKMIEKLIKIFGCVAAKYFDQLFDHFLAP